MNNMQNVSSIIPSVLVIMLIFSFVPFIHKKNNTIVANILNGISNNLVSFLNTNGLIIEHTSVEINGIKKDYET